jgi:hypothetical protein
MSAESVLVRCLVACYPADWRRRYGDEYAAVLSDSLMAAPASRRPALLANIVYGAVDARLNPEGPFMSERVRLPIATAMWAAALFGLAGVGFQKITEYPELREAAEQHAAVGWSYNVLVGAAAAAAIALLLAVVPPAVALVRGRPAGTLRFLAVPPLALLVWVGLLPLAFRLARGHSVHSPANVTAVVVIVVSGLGVVAATAGAVSAVLRRVHVRALPRLRAVILPVVAGAMAATTLACAAWGIALRAGDPAEFNSDDGLLATSLPASWVATTLVMAAATMLAIRASHREISAAARQDRDFA